MGSENFTTGVSKKNKIYLEYLVKLAAKYGSLTGANMATIRFHMEQHEEPVGDKLDALTISNERLTEQIKSLEAKLSLWFSAA